MMSNLWHKLNRLIPHVHKYEHRCDEGEEEHGVNYAKRYCRWCGHEQWLFARPVTMEQSWKDSPDERLRKIKRFWPL